MIELARSRFELLLDVLAVVDGAVSGVWVQRITGDILRLYLNLDRCLMETKEGIANVDMCMARNSQRTTIEAVLKF